VAAPPSLHAQVREIQTVEAKTHFTQIFDEVERGEEQRHKADLIGEADLIGVMVGVSPEKLKIERSMGGRKIINWRRRNLPPIGHTASLSLGRAQNAPSVGFHVERCEVELRRINKSRASIIAVSHTDNEKL
jgi:hypothetical protein